MASAEEQFALLQTDNVVRMFASEEHQGLRSSSEQGAGGGGSLPSSSGRGRRAGPARFSGDVRVLDQQSTPTESGYRPGISESQSTLPDQIRGDPTAHPPRRFDSRRGRHGDYHGRGRDGSHRKNEGFTVRYESEDFSQGQRERDSVEGIEDGNSSQGGTSRNMFHSRRSQVQSRQTFVSGNFRVEPPDQDGVPLPHMQPDVRDEGRRGGNSRHVGRSRGGPDGGNWVRTEDITNPIQISSDNMALRLNRKVPDSGHQRPGRTDMTKVRAKELGGHKDSGINVPQLVQELEVKLSKGKVECMICYDLVNRNAPVWSCISCYSIFHLPCIRKWARAPTSSDLSVSATGNGEANWRCPGCQTVQMSSANELRYYCFCGHMEEPPLDYYITPHSCGGPCRKALDKSKNGQCKHHCTMQCHPGPCPPCKAMAAPQPCPCGKTTCTRRCSEQGKGADTCGQQCGRPLSCGRHKCANTCHEGACESCDVLFEARCFCGRQEEGLRCGQVEPPGQINSEGAVFSCQMDCPRTLPCGNHKCKNKCHPGPCGDCELSPLVVHTCPCGKKPISDLLGSGEQRQSCKDPIPTCQQGCGKHLPCKKHVCKSICHTGSCPACEVPAEQKCQCGASSRTVACYITLGTEVQKRGSEVEGDVDKDGGALFLCDRKCGKKKSCGRHRCNDRCCPAANDSVSSQQDGLEGRDPHLCTLPCGKKLRCKQHNCQELCHAGHCPPCMETTFTELSCSCGRTSIPPPVPCGTPLPSCQFPCAIPQVCGHEATHLCHFGDCPPCTVPVAKECVGNHVVLRGLPCGSRDIKCNKLCGKTRQCGLHACGRTCHLPPCDSMDAESSSQTQSDHSCGQPCGAPRRHCSHTCASPCHPTSQCPEIPCKVIVTISCLCAQLTAGVPCGAGGLSARVATDVAAMALSRLPGPLQPLEGKDREKVPLGQRKLACDDECAKLEKKRLLADAFGATAPGEGVPGLEGGVVGSELLAEFVRREPQWVAAIDDRFKYLVQGPKSGTGPVGNLRLHVFCTMVKERREVIYQMAERWGLTVTGVGREPRRFVLVHVTPKSKVPARSLLPKASTVGLAGPVRAPSFHYQVDMEPGLVVALFDLPREADVSTLVLRFGGECELVWLNDKNALAIFADGTRAATALRRVDHASAYRGAAGLPPAAGSSARSGAWGTQNVVPTAVKPAPSRKGIQDSNWVEDAWSDNKQEVGAWQSKVLPVPTSKNPWGALSQKHTVASSGPAEGSSSSGRPLVSASGLLCAGNRVSATSSVVPSAGGSGPVGMSAGQGSISGPPPLPGLLADGENDDWEKALEGCSL